MPDTRFIPAFHFKVVCSGLDEAVADTAFESVSGLQVTVGMDTAGKKGAAVFNPVVLKRAVSIHPSPLRQWVLHNLHTAKIKPLPAVLIYVLDETHQPAITICIKKVTAAGWQLHPLQAQQSELLQEEIMLHYQEVEWLQP